MAIRPELFDLDGGLSVPDRLPPAVTTPLGRLEVTLEADGSRWPADAAYTRGNRLLVVWMGSGRVEALLIRNDSGTLSSVWVLVRAATATGRVVVRSHWAGGEPAGRPVNPDHPEFQSWTDGATRVWLETPRGDDGFVFSTEGIAVELDGGSRPTVQFIWGWGPDLPPTEDPD